MTGQYGKKCFRTIYQELNFFKKHILRHKNHKHEKDWNIIWDGRHLSTSIY